MGSVAAPQPFTPPAETRLGHVGLLVDDLAVYVSIRIADRGGTLRMRRGAPATSPVERGQAIALITASVAEDFAACDAIAADVERYGAVLACVVAQATLLAHALADAYGVPAPEAWAAVTQAERIVDARGVA